MAGGACLSRPLTIISPVVTYPDTPHIDSIQYAVRTQAVTSTHTHQVREGSRCRRLGAGRRHARASWRRARSCGSARIVCTRPGVVL